MGKLQENNITNYDIFELLSKYNEKDICETRRKLHVGSTSIPGLKAKPVIDILIVIDSLKTIPEIEELLKPYDYENRGPRGIEDRFFFTKGPEEAWTHYIHFTEPNTDTYYNQMLFKKYLINHPEYMPYLYLIQLLCSTYGYKQYILDNNKELLEFAFFRTKICKFLFQYSKTIADELKKKLECN